MHRTAFPLMPAHAGARLRSTLLAPRKPLDFLFEQRQRELAVLGQRLLEQARRGPHMEPLALPLQLYFKSLLIK